MHQLSLKDLIPAALLRQVTVITPQDGGLSDFTWKLKTPLGNYFLKIKGSSLKAQEKITTSPENIRVEARTIELLNSQFCKVVPECVTYNESLGSILLTDVRGASGKYLIDLIKKERISQQKASLVGKSLSHIHNFCLLYTSPSPRDATLSRMPSSA